MWRPGFSRGERRADGIRAVLALLAVALLVLPAGAQRLKVRGRQLVHAGEPVFLFGQGDWLMVGKGLADFQAESRWYQSYGANFVRVNAVNTLIPDEAGPLNPWLRLGDGRYDLENFSVAYWNRLRSFLAANEQAGRFVLLQIFDEVGLESGSNRWLNHPFNPARNINGTPLPSGGDAVPEFYDLANTRILGFQERYVDKLLAETYSFGNVIYQICNEYTGPTSWLQRWIDKFDAAERVSGINLLLTNMSCSQELLDFEMASPGIDLVDLWHAPSSLRFADLPEIRDRFYAFGSGKPVIAGRIGPEPDLTDSTPLDRDRARTIFWTIFFAGGVGATTKEDGDFQRLIFGPPFYSEDTVWEDYLGAFHAIVDGLDPGDAIFPAPGIVQSAPASFAIALQTGGGTTLVYLEDPSGSQGGTLVLDGLPGSSVEASLYSPATGLLLESRRRSVIGGRLEMPVPGFSRDLLVRLGPARKVLLVRLPGFDRTAPFRLELVLRLQSGSPFFVQDDRLLRSGVRFNGTPVEELYRFQRTLIRRPSGVDLVFQSPPVSLAPGYYRFEASVGEGIRRRDSVVRLRID